MTKKITKFGSISRRRLLTTVSAGAALAASPFRINQLHAQEATIKIGFPVPLTGPYGAEAQDQVRAAEVAIAEFNEGGGLGRCWVYFTGQCFLSSETTAQTYLTSSSQAASKAPVC